ncbi:TIGR03619 family F420-dependent LLM class oxidoreductase [Sphaerisporangium rubeum]|uniref:Putative F420-dependent oxidoreductase n=1 Tax=Sphaerisporangium rubeum TaxID=321317 RepID=A0A7X0M6Z2_9ACTN|nr:TIGR03619 family F420-dependent LLM class oxidoreductase [Sphaerisporangium rubeum]MBB6474258.1 putative F420-dependent oxidoreductase [Sphaerisporangium rubeum]
MKIGFGVPVSGTWATPGNMVAVARRAEELGYASLWTFQRLLHPAGEPLAPVYRSVQDPVVTLSFLAGVTSRIRLGVAVLNMPFYSPPLLAKQLATLQEVSRGRLDAGLGLGWMPEEYTASGVTMAARGRRAVEYLHVLRRLWTEDLVSHKGEFYDIPPSSQDPKPVPPPPVLLGGTAPAALRRAGELADGWISSSRADLDTLPEQIYIVKEAAREAGRDPGELRFVCRGVVRVGAARDGERTRLTGTPDQIRDDIEAVAATGMTELFLDLNFDPAVGAPDADPDAAMRRAEEALEAFAPR